MTRILWRRSWRTVAGILVLIAAIFIAESFTTLMSQVLENQGSVLRLALLLTLKLPEIVDFGLPLALMLGLYFAITGARDDRELVICGAAGAPWTQVPRFALLVGLGGLTISLLFATVIKPSSSYAMRLAFYDMELRAITAKLAGEGPTSFTRSIEGRAVIATPSQDDAARAGNLFVYQEDERGIWRFDQADDWGVLARDLETGVKVELRGYRTYSGGPSSIAQPEDSRDPSAVGLTLGPAVIQVSNLVVNIQEDEVLPIRNRDRRSHELLFLGLFEADAGLAALTQPTPRLGEALARALLCPFAALIAVAGAAFAGTGLGRFTALPITTGLVLGFDIVSRALLRDAGTGAPEQFWGTALVLAAGAVLVPLGYVLLRREQILIPARGRA
jgi:lipopolysaccharide export LptBFGC system permease protein LptF